MRILVTLFLLAVLMPTRAATVNFLSLNPPPSTISVAGLQMFCVNEEPYVKVDLIIKGEDLGRPGILYVGAHDPAKTHAQFFVAYEAPRTSVVGRNALMQFQSFASYSGAWQTWDGSLLPPHWVARGGFAGPVTLSIPLGASANVDGEFYDKTGWLLYVGYGVLTVQDEEKVQRAMDGVAKVKAKFPDRPIPAVEADHYRRIMIQEDMSQNAKYRHVLTWGPEWIYSCSNGGN